MPRSDRLHNLIDQLADGRVHTAAALAARFSVTERTIYRDIARLQAEGVSITGAPGQGYRRGGDIALPPMTLSKDELEALHIGLSILGEAADTPLREAATRLSERIDAALPETGETAGARWGFTPSPMGTAPKHLTFLPTVRAALRSRQKLAVTLPDGIHVLRPLALDYWGRTWLCEAWCDSCEGFHRLRLERFEAVDVLPELFVDEPGKDLKTCRATL